MDSNSILVVFLQNNVMGHWCTQEMVTLPGKKTSWKVACKNANFHSAFSTLGTTYEISSDLADQIEHYVGALYGKICYLLEYV